MNADKHSAKRLGDATSVASALVLVVVLLPLSVACLTALVYPLSLWQPSALWLVPVYYCAIGLMFLPGIEDAMWRFAMRQLREPTPAEQARLRPAWSQVLAAADETNRTRYRVRVLETDDLNAAAAGGRQVFITSGALGTVPEAWLPGLLAHELGHHVGLHSVVLSIEVWLLRPIHWVRTIAVWLLRLWLWLRALASGTLLGLIVVLIVSLGFRLVAWALLAVTWLPLALLRIAGRRAEYRADAYAAEIGFRAPLVQFLSALAEVEDELDSSRGQSLADIIASTHPPTRSRIERLQAWQPTDGAQRRAAHREGGGSRPAASTDRPPRQRTPQDRARPTAQRHPGSRRAVRLGKQRRAPKSRPPHRRP